MSATITSITPTNSPDQRNIKVDNQTSDIVLTQIGGIIYINSSSLEHLRGIAKGIDIKTPEYTDIRERERQYGGLTGYLLKTNYKNLPGVGNAIKALLRNNEELTAILYKKAA